MPIPMEVAHLSVDLDDPIQRRMLFQEIGMCEVTLLHLNSLDKKHDPDAVYLKYVEQILAELLLSGRAYAQFLLIEFQEQRGFDQTQFSRAWEYVARKVQRDGG